jgi:hypothetical protein
VTAFASAFVFCVIVGMMFNRKWTTVKKDTSYSQYEKVHLINDNQMDEDDSKLNSA